MIEIAPRTEADADRAILESRARALAKPPARVAGDGEMIEVLLFELGSERYAIETRHIRQVVLPIAWTPIPGAHEFLSAVINLDGEILAVFDVSRALGLEPRGQTEKTRVVVLGDGRDEFGISIDSAYEVTSLRVDDLFEFAGPTDAHRLMRGVTGELIGVIDGVELLADGRFRAD